MKNETVNHPTFEQLSAFLLGLPSVGNRRALEQHIEHCDECCETLADVVPDAMTALAHEAGSAFVRDDTSSPQPEQRITQRNSLPRQLVDHPRYHVTKVLGAGGMGTVYKAEHRMMQRTVALKVIRDRLVSQRSAVQRFEQEVRAAARLDHPNIVTAFDAETAGDLHFLVMEYVEGATLATQVEEGGPLSIRYACEFIRQAALGLQHAHEQGMVHRDIKPQNLKIRRDTKEVKILDFGLARFASETELIDTETGETVSGGLTRADSVIGTPDYMAPEQFTDARSADIRADIYSLGCTLYFLLTGQPPFASGSMSDKLSAHRSEDRPSVDDVRQDVPPELTAIIQRMIAKEPVARYQTPKEVADALGQVVDGSSLASYVVPPPLPDVLDGANATKHFRRVWVASSIVLVVLLATAAFIAVPPTKPRILYVLAPYGMYMSDYDSRAMLDVANTDVTTACSVKRITQATRSNQQFDPKLTADLLLSEVDAEQFDAVVFVGAGMWQFWCWDRGVSEEAHRDVQRIVHEFASQKKPIACLQKGRTRLVGPLQQSEPFAPQLQLFSEEQQQIWSEGELSFGNAAEDDGFIVANTTGDGRRFLHELLNKLGR